MLERLDPIAKRAIALAQAEVVALGHTSISVHHMFLGLMSSGDEGILDILSKDALTVASVRSYIGRMLPSEAGMTPVRFEFSDDSRSALRLALTSALSSASPTISPKHLLVGVLRAESPFLEEMLRNFKSSTALLLDRMRNVPAGEEVSTGPEVTEGGLPVRGGAPAGSLTNLERFATDLVVAAKEGRLDPVKGRDDEISRMVTILCRRSKNNPVLVGEAGVGKTAVVEGLAQRIAAGDVPELLKDRSVWSLDLAALLGGTQYRGDFEERVKAITKELSGSNGIVFIDEVHSIIGSGAGRSNGSSAADLLKPALSRGELTMIGATTLDEYRQIEKDPALERRFAPVTIEAPSVAQTVSILRALRSAYEEHHKVTITDAALEAAARLSDSHISDRQLPDKAIDVLDEAGAAAAMARLRSPEGSRELYDQRAGVQLARREALVADEFDAARELALKELALTSEILLRGDDVATVSEDAIARIVSAISGVSVSLLSEDESARLMHLEDLLAKRVIGQDAAKAVISKGVRRRRSGVGAKRPDSYIFAGPTGVGKTELAKALAEVISGDDKRLVQIDMSEYGEKHALSRLIGPPPGYVGYDEPGLLTEPVKRNPSSVILLDEIEKAHPDIFNLFLQVLEDGHLTDSSGRRVDFSNTTLIFTSNLGSGVAKSLGFSAGGVAGQTADRERREQATMLALKESFRPEFLNRIDHTVIFDPLNETDLRAIASIMVSRVELILAARNIRLLVTDAALDHLSAEGFDAEFGARPLRRTIQRLIEDKLSEQLLQGLIVEGDTVVIDFADALTFGITHQSTALKVL